MNKNLVSVVVPVYNVAPYLERCLSSLVSQTYKDMEILLIDDGSTDVSSNICDDYAQYYKNIVVVHQSNSGVSAARNKALDIAKGEYIYFVDPDDWCEPDTIEKLHKCLQKTNADFASCSMYTNKSVERQIPPPQLVKSLAKYQTTEGEQGVYLVGIEQTFPLHLFGNYSSRLYCGMFRNEIIKKYHIRFDTNIFKAEDWLFYTQYLSHAKNEAIVDQPLYHYFLREGSLIHSYYEETETGILKGRHILSEFERYLNEAGIPNAWYQGQLSVRYCQSILRYAINIWDYRNPRSIIGKYKKVGLYLKTWAYYSKIDIKTLNFWQRMIVGSKSTFLLSLYAIAFHIAKKFKNALLAVRK